MPVEKQLVSDKLETTQDDIVTAEELKTRLAARDVKEFSYTATDGLRSYLEDNQSDKEEFKNMCTNILLEEGTPALLQGIATAAEGADLSDPNNITLTPEQRNMVAIISLYLFTTDQPSTLEDVVTYISEGTDDAYKPKDITKTESTGVVLGEGTVVEGAPAGTVVDGATKDGAVVDGVAKDGAVVEGATKDGAVVDGVAKDGAIVDGVAKDGAVVDGVAKDGAVVDGVAKDGAVVDGVAKDGAVVDGVAKDGAVVDGVAKDGAVVDGVAKDGAVQNLNNNEIQLNTNLDTQTPLDNAFNALETQFATLGEAFKIPGVKEAGKKHFDDLQTKMKGIADKLNTAENRAKMEIAFQKVGIDPQNPRDMQDLPKIASLLMNSDETGLSEVGTVLHTGMMEGLSALSGSMDALSTDLSNIQDKQPEKNTNLQVLIDGLCTAEEQITELSSKIDTPEEFASILRLAKQYPTQVASGIDNQMSAGTDHLDGMLLPVNRSNSLRNARGNTEAEFVNRAQEKLISEATAENIGENVSYILENYQDTTINGEIVYFNKRQLQEQGLADENGTIKPNSDQLLAEAFQNKTIGGFSLSKMVHSLYDNKNFTLLDTDQAGDLRDASDEEQKEFFTSIAVAQDRPYTFTEKQTKQQVQAGELSKKLSGKPQEVKSKITQITNQKALKMNATMIEEPNADQGKLDFYKVANGGKEFYISSKEFGKFKKPHESMSKKETSRTADNALSEMDNLRIDYRTLALQKYNIQGLEKTRDITEQKTAAGVSEKKLQFTDKSNDTATFTLDIAKTDTPTIIFPETGKTIPTTLAHAENDITNATKYVSVVNTYTQRWTKNTDKRTDLQTKQLTFLDDHAQQLITGSKKPSNGTSHAGENGFGQDIDFSKGGITIANFAYDDKNQKLNYIPSQNTKEVIATAE